MSFRIERARPGQLRALCAIERAALELFRGHPAWASYAVAEIPPVALAEGIAAGRVWVALGSEATPLGFIWLVDSPAGGEGLSIAEFGVLPEHGRRGIGTALLETACTWARASAYRYIDLGTLADVPWNAPFYAKHGFAIVDKYAPEYAEALARDREHDFPDALRVFMRRELAAPDKGDWSVWPAPAKLNLFLRIIGRRTDGYHQLQTVFRILDWGDELCIRLREDGELRRVSELAGVAPGADLVIRAARLLQQTAGVAKGAEIAVEKRIPMGGGLGGGSSDAATVLVALNALWQAGLDEDALAELGRQLGADVPVFVRGRSAWAEGVGERLRPIELPPRWYAVIDPGETVPTAALFQAPELTRAAPVATMRDFACGQVEDNSFEPVVRSRHPRVAAALDWLAGRAQAKLSGSGGCIFAEAARPEDAWRWVRTCPAPFTAYFAAGVERSPLLSALSRQRRRVGLA